jgi:anti-anti-sigma factor
MAAAMFIVKCPTCGAEVKRDAQVIELQGRCPTCGGVMPPRPLPDSGPRRRPRDADERPRMLDVLERDGVAVVTFGTSGLVERANVQQLGDELDALVDKMKLRRIVLDFVNVKHMSSTVMSKLAAFYQKVKDAKGHLRLCRVGEHVLEVFQIMKYDKLFTIMKTQAEAIGSLKRK